MIASWHCSKTHFYWHFALIYAFLIKKPCVRNTTRSGEPPPGGGGFSGVPSAGGGVLPHRVGPNKSVPVPPRNPLTGQKNLPRVKLITKKLLHFFYMELIFTDVLYL